MSIRTLLAGVALAAVATSGAQALTWTSLLEYRDVGGAAVKSNTPYGAVVVDEVDAFTLHVTVTLTNPASRFINTGGPHDPFVFNTLSDNQVSNITGGSAGNPDASFYDAGHGAFSISGFGQGNPGVPFTDKIGLHVYHPAVPETPCTWNPAHTRCRGGSPAQAAYYTEPNGFPGGQTGALAFDIHNAAGITFAGTGLTVGDGLVATSTPGVFKFDGVNYGDGEHLASTSLGWWFAADIWDADANNGQGATYNVAARDATTPYIVPTTSPTPEPAAWALMISGFGAAGAMLRRRRAALA